jgi:hypothetical protein
MREWRRGKGEEGGRGVGEVGVCMYLHRVDEHDLPALGVVAEVGFIEQGRVSGLASSSVSSTGNLYI